MKKVGRLVLYALAVLLVLVGVGPFLVPVPPLEGTQPVEALADPDSRFIKVNGIDVHYKMSGQGEPVFVLLHGFGASLYSWHAVVEPFSRLGMVIAYDRVAFGLTGRPMEWEGQNPYSPQAAVDLLLGLLDQLQVRQAILVGNSAGGTVAMQFTLQYPDRVRALILVDPAVYESGGGPAWLRPLYATPQMQHLGPLLARQIAVSGPGIVASAWHDPDKLDAGTLALYQKPLRAANWDRAAWYFTAASRPPDLSGRLGGFRLPVLVITGDDDRIVPTANSVRLADELPGARLVVIPETGHLPHEERPDLFMEAVQAFLAILL